MNKKVYFAGSIRGGQNDTALYHDIIAHIDLTDHVLTEHVGDITRSLLEKGRNKDQLIYEQDTAWLRECDVVIAECTHPSLGVGYEMAYAEKYKKPVYIFYRHSETELSAMLTGDSYYHIQSYETKEELFPMIDAILK
jgi:nucleoside 2-deoxyribosyltransferase